MPGIEDWKTRPYSTIQQIFEEHAGDSCEAFVKNVEDYFTKRLSDYTIKTLPSVNSVPLEQLRSGSLVKFRCLVQDVFDPQFICGKFKVTSKDGTTSRLGCGFYRDFPEVGPNETVDFDSPNSVTVERKGFYCVPIPGESSWVKEINDRHCKKTAPSASSIAGREKRRRDEEESDMESDQKVLRDCEALPAAPSGDGASNKTDGQDQEMNSVGENGATNTNMSATNLPNLNMPLPDEKGVPCIVRVYSSEVDLLTTDSVEIIGILCMDPRLASIFDDGEESDISEREELQAHELPASLVPRLHAIIVRRLEHNNPSLPPSVKSDIFHKAVSDLMVDSCSLRLELLSVLEHALLGDRLAAEYLLCHIISRVYARVDVLPLGKLCLNVSGCPTWPRYTKFFHHLISQLTTQSVFLEMSIENMNALTLVPKKDYAQNRLTAGMLQLAKGTSLVVDETALQQGQLGPQGVLSVKALADLIRWQRVDYDFQWHPIPVHTDVNVVILSEGESLLPKDVHVPLSRPQEELDVVAHFTKLDSRLTPENIEKLRAYISACRLMDYVVSEETQKIIQEDFVETRQANPNNMSVEDFQTLLGLVRLICLSHGKSSPTLDMWRAARVMEETRKARVAELPASSRGSL